MNKEEYTWSFESNGPRALQKFVRDVVSNMEVTGEEQVFKVRLVLNELLSSVMDNCPDEGRIQAWVRRLDGCVEININDAGDYAWQLLRLHERMSVCRAFEESRSRMILVRAMADELVFNVKRNRLTAVVSTA